MLTHVFSVPRVSMFTKSTREPPRETHRVQERIVKAAKQYTSKEGYMIAEVFMTVPSKEEYPDYHEIVPELIDVTIIEQRVKNKEFPTLIDMVRAFDAMFENAIMYNPVHTEVHDDALELMLFIRSEAFKFNPAIRTALQGGKSNLVDLRAKIQLGPRLPGDFQLSKKRRTGEPMTTTVSSVEKKPKSKAIPMKTAAREMYAKIAQYKNTDGEVLSEQFLVQPSRKEDPRWHEVTDNPIDLNTIARRIQGGVYKDVDNFSEEMRRVFDASINYYPKEHKKHQDALTLRARVTLEAEQVGSVAPSSSDMRFTLKVKPGSGGTTPRGTIKPAKAITLESEMMNIFNPICAMKSKSGDLVCEIFMELPDMDEYPDYYEIIDRPLAFDTIEKRIKLGKYRDLDAMVADFTQVFNNAHTYNEVGSIIYNYASILKSNVMKRVKASRETLRASGVVEVNPDAGDSAAEELAEKAVKNAKTLIAAIDRVKSNNQPLSALFETLPDRKANPKYHLAVSTPIDLKSIRQRAGDEAYPSPSAVVADLLLLFTNALVVEEPSTMRFNAAQRLLRVVRDTAKKCLSNQDNMAIAGLATQNPPLYSIIGELLDVLESADSAAGSKVSSNFSMPPEQKAGKLFYQLTPDALMLSRLKEKMYSAEYSRLDTFADDVASMLEDARVRHPKGPVHDELVKLQHRFVEKLQTAISAMNITSPAAKHTKAALQLALAAEKAAAPLKKAEPDGTAAGLAGAREVESAETGDGTKYVPGEYVYCQAGDGDSVRPSVYLIQTLHKMKDGSVKFKGIFYAYPEQTVHVPTRMFYDKEIFRTNDVVVKDVKHLVGTCWVLSLKQYCSSVIVGQRGEDAVYVCESRYNTKAKAFSKIKNFNTRESAEPDLIPRTETLDSRSLPKVKSIFAEDPAAQAAAAAATPEVDASVNVLFEGEVEHREPGATYYSLFYLDHLPLSLGDVVFLRSDNEDPFQARIETMWVDGEGVPYFHGHWYMHPKETHHMPSKTFYEKEVILGATHETNSLLSIVKKVAVMHIADYVQKRPLGVVDDDVFVCESKWVERGKNIVRIKNLPGIPGALEPELYELPELAKLRKIPSPFAANKLMMKEDTVKVVDVVDAADPPWEESPRVVRKEKKSKNATTPAGVAFPSKKEGEAKDKPVPRAYKKKLPLRDNLERELQNSRQSLKDTEKKMQKFTSRVIDQAARLAAIEAGGDGSEVDYLGDFSSIPQSLDAFTVYANEQRQVSREEAGHTWMNLSPVEQAPYMARAAKADNILRSAFAAGAAEKAKLGAMSGAAAPLGAAAGLGFPMSPQKGPLALPEADKATLPAAVVKELERNPQMLKLSAKYQKYIGDAPAATGPKTPPVGDGRLPAPQVCLDSAVKSLQFLEKSLNGDLNAMRHIFLD